MRFFLSLFFLFSLSLASCSKNTSQTITLTGSSTIAPLMTQIAKAFEKENPQIRVNVQSGGSSRGVADVRRGSANIGMASRAPKDSEKDLQWHLLARDGLAMIVNSSNPVKELSRQQIIDIYTGKIKNWDAVGGKKASISVNNKAEGRGTLEVFLKYLKIKNTSIKADIIVGENMQAIKSVEADPTAIAYLSIGAAEYEAKRGGAIRLITLEGVAATSQNLSTGLYPLARSLNLITAKKPEGTVKALIDFARSPQVFSLIRAQYFVPIEK